MRSLFRSFAVITALSLPLIAHATPVTYSGTVSLTDITKSNEHLGGNSFSFNYPGTGTLFNPYDDSLSIDGNISNDDVIDLKVSFTAPGSGTGNIFGEDFQGRRIGNNIDWTIPASDQVDLSNGSVAYINLGFFGYTDPTALSSCSRGSADVCGSTDLYITVTDNDPAAAPEPSSLMLLGTGVLGAAGMLRRRFAL